MINDIYLDVKNVKYKTDVRKKLNSVLIIRSKISIYRVIIKRYMFIL